jgi:hypothetical protein
MYIIFFGVNVALKLGRHLLSSYRADCALYSF